MDKEFKLRSEVQHSCMRRFMAATGFGPEKWASMGYAEAFAKAWDKDKVRNCDAVYQIVLDTASSVGKVLG